MVLWAQQPGTDQKQQLEKRLRIAKSVKDKISANYAMANFLSESDSVAAEKYFQDGLALARLHHNMEGQAKYYHFKASRKYNQGMFEDC